jgi:hypothetical protein
MEHTVPCGRHGLISTKEADVVPTLVVDTDLCSLPLSRVRCELQADPILAEGSGVQK